MKYCVDYSSKNSVLEKVDEINIDIVNKEITNVVDFAKKYKNQRINLCINDYEEGINEGFLKAALDVQKENPDLNLVIRIAGYSQDLAFILADYPDAKFYFNIWVDDWDRFIGFIEYGVSDIFVCEGLGFELDTAAAVAHEAGVQIRVFPNVAQSKWRGTPSLKTFFIRPEDIGSYEPYVDVCEFFGEKEKQDTYYNIYKKDKQWFGNLGEIIIGFNDIIDSRYIIPRFAKKRIKCGRECMKGGPCKICDRIVNLSHNLEEAGLIVKKDKRKEK